MLPIIGYSLTDANSGDGRTLLEIAQSVNAGRDVIQYLSGSGGKHKPSSKQGKGKGKARSSENS